MKEMVNFKERPGAIYIYIYILFILQTRFDIVTCLTKGRRYYATLLSLLGNRNNSMDTLTTPVLLRCMITKSRKTSVSIGSAGCYLGKTIHNSPSQSAPGVSLLQSTSEVSPGSESSK
jgi:hypothetical protein